MEGDEAFCSVGYVEDVGRMRGLDDAVWVFEVCCEGCGAGPVEMAVRDGARSKDGLEGSELEIVSRGVMKREGGRPTVPTLLVWSFVINIELLPVVATLFGDGTASL